jgi:glucokinase
MEKATNSLMKQMNKSTLLSIVFKEEKISRAQLAKMTKIAKSSVSLLVDELLHEGLVIETGEGVSSSKGGRKPIHLMINQDYGYVISLVIRHHVSNIAVCDLDGNILQLLESSMDEFRGEPLLIELEKIIKSQITCFKGIKKLLGIGISIPGIVDMERGVILHSPELELQEYNIRDRWNEKFGCEIFIDNDVNMQSLGENWKGAGQEYRDFVEISIGTGIGAAIVLNNQLYRGASCIAGEVGYMAISEDALNEGIYRYDRFGHFESKASIKRLETMAGKTFVELIQEAEAGNTESLEMILKTSDLISLGIANIVSLLNPEAVIINGRYRYAKGLVEQHLIQRVEQLTPIRTRLEFSDLGSKASIYGCVATVLTNLLGIKFL